MKIPLSWLREYIDIDVSVDELCEKLTMLGLEIEGVERLGERIDGVVVGRIIEAEPHPDADRLQVCKTDVGADEPLQIVCGATNFKVGDCVPTAVVGAMLPGGFAIGKRKMRGVPSQGMMCSAKELGMGEDHAGLLILDGDPAPGADIKALLGLDDVVLEIEVTPNRGDWAGLIGIARELAAAYGKRLKWPEAKIEEGGPNASKLSSVTIANPELCSRYAGRVLQGVTIGPSPDWLKKRLIASGQRPINNIVDVTNYVLLETGHPLHAFDFDKLVENRIVVRTAKPGETIKTIDQADRTLDGEMLVIADANAPVAVAGVMGGFDSEVGDSTANIFLESAHFHPPSVRRTAKQLNLASEASQRFQRGADPDMVPFALDRAASLILQVAGGKCAKDVLDEYPAKSILSEIPLNFNSMKQFIGTDVSPEKQISILESLEFRCIDQTAESARFEVPARRYDVTREADLIEEIARLYGYDRLPASLPRIHPMPDRVEREFDALAIVRDRLLGAGLSEAVHWTFQQAEDRAWEWGNVPGWVPLSNPLSERHAGMRTTLLPGLVQTVAANLRKGATSLAFFEIGPCYWEEDGAIRQETRLAVVLGGNAAARHFSAPERPYDLLDLKGILDALNTADLPLDFSGTDHAKFAPGQGASIVKGKNTIGIMGALSTPVRAVLDVEHHPLNMLEVSLAPFLPNASAEAVFQEIPKYPSSHRDIAIIVAEEVSVGAIGACVRDKGGDKLRNVRLFDVYTGKPIPAGQRSLAFALTFQDAERTLKDKEVDKAIGRITKALEAEFGARLR